MIIGGKVNKEMRRNYYQFFPSSPPSHDQSSSSCSQSLTNCSSVRHQITIFQSDASELQTIAILWLARMEMEEKWSKSQMTSTVPYMQFQLHASTARGHSLKKSLKKFLQQRKDRIRAVMPYSH